MISLITLAVIFLAIVLTAMLSYWFGRLIGTMNRNNEVYARAEEKEKTNIRLAGILFRLRKEFVNEMIRAKLLEQANSVCYDAGYKECYERFVVKGKKQAIGTVGIDEEGRIKTINN